MLDLLFIALSAQTMDLRVGLLMNFNVMLFKDGFQRVVY
jgi:hypothetical protein